MVIVIRTIIYYNNLGSRVISQFINNMFYLYTFIMRLYDKTHCRIINVSFRFPVSIRFLLFFQKKRFTNAQYNLSQIKRISILYQLIDKYKHFNKQSILSAYRICILLPFNAISSSPTAPISAFLSLWYKPDSLEGSNTKPFWGSSIKQADPAIDEHKV